MAYLVFFSSIFNYSFSIFSSNHCFGDSSLFSVNTSPDSVLWNFGDPESGLANTSDLVSPTHQFSAPGVYSVSATVFLLDSVLFKETEVTITDPEVNLGSDTTLCNGAVLTLEATNSNAAYLWQDFSTSDTLKVNTEGLYWVEVNKSTCTSIDSIYIAIDPPISAILSGGDTTCRGVPFSNAFISTTGLGPFSIEYSNNFNDYIFFGEEDAYHVFIGDSGTYSLTNIIGAHNCVGTVSGTALYVTLRSPYADFSVGSKEVIKDFNTVSIKNNSIGHNWSEWSFGDGFFLEDSSSIVHHVYGDFGTYFIELVVENDIACRDSLSQFFVVQSNEYFVPNAFTPNDGNILNDSFGLYNTRAENFEMKIFDKWGKAVYITDDIERPWDGTIKGSPAQIGTYNYRITLLDPLGNIRKLTGSVQLLK